MLGSNDSPPPESSPDPNSIPNNSLKFKRLSNKTSNDFNWVNKKKAEE